MDTIFFNGNVITMDNAKEKVEAVAVKDGIILRTGSNDEILALKNDNTNLVDLKGKLMLPGFNDSHMHLINYAYSQKKIPLYNLQSLDELINFSKEFIFNMNIDSNDWILGVGWNHDYWSEKKFPTKEDLDKISTTNPICFTRACGHVLCVNSKALSILGINKNTQQIEGGHFDVDSNGDPTGIFRENAMNLIYNNLPAPSIEEIKELILIACNDLLKQGITSVQSDDFESVPGKDYEKIIRAYMELSEEGKLPIRVYQQCLLSNIHRLRDFLGKGYYTGYGNDFFKLGPLKILGDGSLGARTALLTEPYHDDNSTFGISLYTQDELDELVETAHNNNMHVAIHCIGDKMMYMAFESIEKAMTLNPRTDPRHSIVHCQITDETLLNKFRDLNVVAHVQPIFLHYDLHMVEDRVGKKKASTSYNFKTMLDLGVHVAIGSDAPVEPFDSLPNLYCAINRKDKNGFPEDGFYSKECLSVFEAVKAFTIEGAYASFEEKIKGSISIGKYADFVILNEDIFEIEKHKIKDVSIFGSVVGGKMYLNIF